MATITNPETLIGRCRLMNRTGLVGVCGSDFGCFLPQSRHSSDHTIPTTQSTCIPVMITTRY